MLYKLFEKKERGCHQKNQMIHLFEKKSAEALRKIR